MRYVGPILLLLAGLSLAPPAVAASVWQQQSDVDWRKQDHCAHDALVKFPDYTRDSNAKRAHAVQECEAKANVLQRPAENVSPVKRIPDWAAD